MKQEYSVSILATLYITFVQKEINELKELAATSFNTCYIVYYICTRATCNAVIPADISTEY